MTRYDSRRLLPETRGIYRLLSATLAIASLGLFSGCKDDEPEVNHQNNPIEILLAGDPFAYVLEKLQPQLRENLHAPVNFDIERYSDTRRSILSNSADHQSHYNLVSFDSLWLPRLAEEGALSPITGEDLSKMGIGLDIFYPESIEIAQWDGALYGLPIQPHFELLFYRKDWLDEKGLRPPETFEELIEQARAFHDPANGRYGLCWNGLRGQALGQTISHFYAAFGQPVISAGGTPKIDTETGTQVANYLLALVEVSPPDILNMAWDQRIQRFQRGQAAFTYGWGARSIELEHDPASQVKGKVGYAVPPGANSTTRSAPFGQWSLGLPVNLTPEQRERSLQTLGQLYQENTYEFILSAGLHNSYRSQPESTRITSDYLQTNEFIFGNSLVSPDARPRIRKWSSLGEILGTRFHDILLGRVSVQEGLAIAQAEADEQFKEILAVELP